VIIKQEEQNVMEDRRRFFRLDDEVVLDFQTISREEISAWKESHQQHKDELSQLEQDIGNHISQMKSQDPTIARLFELFNQKINMLGSRQPLNTAKREMSATEARTRINLSACGMAFHTHQSIEKDDHLLLNMQLKPSNAELSLTGKVVSVEESSEPEEPNLVRIDFSDLKGAEQEVLIQHLFQLQNRHLKLRNEDSANDV
jgi:uncharacterized protein YdcH (DUF465 family)